MAQEESAGSEWLTNSIGWAKQNTPVESGERTSLVHDRRKLYAELIQRTSEVSRFAANFVDPDLARAITSVYEKQMRDASVVGSGTVPAPDVESVPSDLPPSWAVSKRHKSCM